ncbi:MAG: hypothetical protein M9928_21670 [Anaerolineae bacterium]|nr:hypothetical protein [Anaerolineae bacterium]MCO5195478.1 hypothetical protein [Anaerolineae bacterium]MCO5207625.1 hypothetical protein [Anaerolineae bacterium]
MPRRTYVVVGIALALLVIVTVVFAALQWLVYSQSRQAPPPFSYTVAIDEPLTVCADGVLEIPVSGISAETVTRVTVYQDITTRQNTPVRDNIFDPIYRPNGIVGSATPFDFTQYVDLAGMGIEPGEYIYHRVASYTCDDFNKRNCIGAVGYAVPFAVVACGE